jgi:hypothetical protein
MPSKATRRVSKGFLLDEFTALSPLLTLRVTFSTGCYAAVDGTTL